MEEKTLECKICGRMFTWSLGEQQFFEDRGLDPPKRCPQCRAKKRRDSNELAELKARIRELEEKENERVFQSPQ